MAVAIFAGIYLVISLTMYAMWFRRPDRVRPYWPMLDLLSALTWAAIGLATDNINFALISVPYFIAAILNRPERQRVSMNQ